MSSILDDLSWRGLLVQTTGAEALARYLSQGSSSVYCGFDPTASSLHVGHLTQIIMMRRFQRAGHRPIAVVGGATGLIGDPRMSGERVMNPPEVVQSWVEALQAQIMPLLDGDGECGLRVVNNLEWVGQMGALELLRDIGKNFRMGTMLSKETVASRLNGEGLSYTEFSYQILQAVDYLELYRRYGVQLQSGGNDQWGNLVAGVELIRRVEGAEVHALTTPLVTKADGTKFSKSEGDAVWLDPQLTSPYAFYQFWLGADDRDVVNYLKFFTFRGREEIDALARRVDEAPHAREAQRALADDLTAYVHGAEALDQAKKASQVLFGRGDVRELGESTLGSIAQEIPSVDAAVGTALVDSFVATGLVASKGAARRAVAERGLSINGVTLEDVERPLVSEDLLPGGYVLLRRGKKNMAMLKVGG
ncbi:tyrosine--tRNA ligase [Devriesea agamarum]|uniref:tyrosine--tRNA ligase n=1 Tax=Devriesea agamarum TaxID=472569 RepID=UPI00071D4758|nr:tyrosine--tRNA ligase [Devriesea agamarum]